MKKVVRTSLNNVANKRGVRDLNIQLYSHDKNNAGFEFVIKNEVDLSEYKAKVLFDFQESFATWETKGTIEGNVVKVKFDTTFITKCEEVIGYLFLDSETDTLDVFKFKFNVVLSEIDKYDMAKRGFRYIKDQEVVDVITRSELQEELAKLQVNAGIDLSNYLTTTVAEETYVKKSDLPTPYNDSELVQKIGQLEARVDKDTVYDDTPLKQRVEALETKVDKDTIYNDEEVKQRLTVLENKPAIDTSHFITDEILDNKNYLATTVAEETYAKKSEIPQPYNDSVLLERVTNLENKTDKDTVYDDTNIKERLTNLENKPTVDASNFVTNEALEEKHYVTNEQISSTYATKSEIPQQYSDTELVKRITVLENKQDNDTIYDDTVLRTRFDSLDYDVRNSVDLIKRSVEDIEYKLRDYDSKISGLDSIISYSATKNELNDYVKRTELPAPYDDTNLRQDLESTIDNVLGNKETEFNSKFVLKDDLRTLVTEIVNQLKSENN